MSFSASVTSNGCVVFREQTAIDYDIIERVASKQAVDKLRYLFRTGIDIEDEALVKRCRNNDKYHATNAEANATEARPFVLPKAAFQKRFPRLKYKHLPPIRELLVREILDCGLGPETFVVLDEYVGTIDMDGLPDLDPAYQFWVVYIKAQNESVNFARRQTILELRHSEKIHSLSIERAEISLKKNGDSAKGATKVVEAAKSIKESTGILLELREKRHALEEDDEKLQSPLFCMQSLKDETDDGTTAQSIQELRDLEKQERIAAAHAHVDMVGEIGITAPMKIKEAKERLKEHTAAAIELQEKRLSLESGLDGPLSSHSGNMEKIQDLRNQEMQERLAASDAEIEIWSFVGFKGSGCAEKIKDARQLLALHTAAEREIREKRLALERELCGVAADESPSLAKDDMPETLMVAGAVSGAACVMNAEYVPDERVSPALEEKLNVYPAETAVEDVVSLLAESATLLDIPTESMNAKNTLADTPLPTTVVIAKSDDPNSQATNANESNTSPPESPTTVTAMVNRVPSNGGDIATMPELPSSTLATHFTSSPGERQNRMDSLVAYNEKFKKFADKLSSLVGALIREQSAIVEQRASHAEVVSQVLAWTKGTPLSPCIEGASDPPTYLDVNTNLDRMTEAFEAQYSTSVVDEAIQFEATTRIELNARVKEATEAVQQLEHYERKVEKLQSQRARVVAAGKPYPVAAAEKLQRNQDKLVCASEKYSECDLKLRWSGEAIENAWLVIYPLLVQFIQFEILESQKKAEIKLNLRDILEGMSECVKKNAVDFGSSTVGSPRQVWSGFSSCGPNSSGLVAQTSNEAGVSSTYDDEEFDQPEFEPNFEEDKQDVISEDYDDASDLEDVSLSCPRKGLDSSAAWKNHSADHTQDAQSWLSLEINPPETKQCCEKEEEVGKDASGLKDECDQEDEPEPESEDAVKCQEVETKANNDSLAKKENILSTFDPDFIASLEVVYSRDPRGCDPPGYSKNFYAFSDGEVHHIGDIYDYESESDDESDLEILVG